MDNPYRTAHSANAPVLRWRRRDPVKGWRYEETPPDAKHPPGRPYIRTKIDGKLAYAPVVGDPAAALKHALWQFSSWQTSVELQGLPPKPVPAEPVAKVIPWERPSDNLEHEVERYIRNREAAGRLEAAGKARVALFEFMKLMPTVKKVSHVTTTVLLAYVNALKATRLQPRTVADKYERLTYFLKFAGSNVRLDRDSRPKVTRKAVTTYTPSELKKLFAAADEYMTVVMSLGLRLGLREQEIAYAEWSDVTFEIAEFKVQDKPHRSFHVKDSEERVLHIPADVLKLLREWRASRPETVLIVGNGADGHHVNGHMLRQLQAVAKRAGVKDATLHKLRRTFATTLLHTPGFDLATVQTYMGHSDIASTMRYIKANEHAKHRIDSVKFF